VDLVSAAAELSRLTSLTNLNLNVIPSLVTGMNKLQNFAGDSLLLTVQAHF